MFRTLVTSESPVEFVGLVSRMKATKVKQVDTYHALVAMRKQHHQAALSDPLVLPTADELIDNALWKIEPWCE